jgi:hypothetical protein
MFAGRNRASIVTGEARLRTSGRIRDARVAVDLRRGTDSAEGGLDWGRRRGFCGMTMFGRTLRDKKYYWHCFSTQRGGEIMCVIGNHHRKIVTKNSQLILPQNLTARHGSYHSWSNLGTVETSDSALWKPQINYCGKY